MTKQAETLKPEEQKRPRHEVKTLPILFDKMTHLTPYETVIPGYTHVSAGDELLIIDDVRDGSEPRPPVIRRVGSAERFVSKLPDDMRHSLGEVAATTVILV